MNEQMILPGTNIPPVKIPIDSITFVFLVFEGQG